MAFGLFSGSTPTYKGTSSIQPQSHAGVAGFISTLFGGARTPPYQQPPPDAPAPVVEDSAEAPVVATDKALTVIVVLDTEALAEALLPKLEEAAASITEPEPE